MEAQKEQEMNKYKSQRLSEEYLKSRAGTRLRSDAQFEISRFILSLDSNTTGGIVLGLVI